jgi:hypothetical protein
MDKNELLWSPSLETPNPKLKGDVMEFLREMDWIGEGGAETPARNSTPTLKSYFKEKNLIDECIKNSGGDVDDRSLSSSLKRPRVRRGISKKTNKTSHEMNDSPISVATTVKRKKRGVLFTETKGEEQVCSNINNNDILGNFKTSNGKDSNTVDSESVFALECLETKVECCPDSNPEISQSVLSSVGNELDVGVVVSDIKEECDYDTPESRERNVKFMQQTPAPKNKLIQKASELLKLPSTPLVSSSVSKQKQVSLTLDNHKFALELLHQLAREESDSELSEVSIYSMGVIDNESISSVLLRGETPVVDRFIRKEFAETEIVKNYFKNHTILRNEGFSSRDSQDITNVSQVWQSNVGFKL